MLTTFSSLHINITAPGRLADEGLLLRVLPVHSSSKERLTREAAAATVVDVPDCLISADQAVGLINHAWLTS